MVQKFTEVLSWRELDPGLRGALPELPPSLPPLLPFCSLSEGRAEDPKVGEGESVFLSLEVSSPGAAEAVVILSAAFDAVLAAWLADEPFGPESPHATNDPARMAAAATTPTRVAVPEAVDRTDPL